MAHVCSIMLACFTAVPNLHIAETGAQRAANKLLEHWNARDKAEQGRSCMFLPLSHSPC